MVSPVVGHRVQWTPPRSDEPVGSGTVGTVWLPVTLQEFQIYDQTGHSDNQRGLTVTKGNNESCGRIRLLEADKLYLIFQSSRALDLLSKRAVSRYTLVTTIHSHRGHSVASNLFGTVK